MSDSISDSSIKRHEKREDIEVVVCDEEDNVQLELLGYKQEFKRDFSLLGLFALCSSELSVLVGVSGTIWYVLSRISVLRVTELTFVYTRYTLGYW